MITILLVDDDPLIHDTLAAILPAEYRVIGARTAPEFYERIDAEPADVVLMDVALGTDDGIELVRQVNTRPDAPPMVMVSAHDDIELVVEAMRAGAVDYLIKPLSLDKLRATVRQAVAMRRRRPCCRGRVREPGWVELVGRAVAVATALEDDVAPAAVRPSGIPTRGCGSRRPRRPGACGGRRGSWTWHRASG